MAFTFVGLRTSLHGHHRTYCGVALRADLHSTFTPPRTSLTCLSFPVWCDPQAMPMVGMDEAVSRRGRSGQQFDKHGRTTPFYASGNGEA